MKFAYLIFVHQSPQQFIRLLQRLDTADSLFFVHIDKKTDVGEFKKVTTVVEERKIIWLKRWNIVWGGFNSIKATLHGLEQVNNSAENITHVSFISGQDYPIKPVQEYHEFLKQKKDLSFLEYSPLPRPNWQNGGMDRIEFYHIYFNTFKIAFPLLTFLKTKLPHASQKKWNFLKKIAPYLPSFQKLKRPFIKGYKPYEGSSWFTFSSSFVQDILQELERNQKFYRFFKFTQCSDEIFFQTLLLNCLPQHVSTTVNDNLRHIIFDDNTGRPYSYTLDHFDSLQNSPAFFARKFDVVNSKSLMDKIDKMLLKQEEIL